MEGRKLRRKATSDSSSGSERERKRSKERRRERKEKKKKKRKDEKRRKREYSSDSSSDDEERSKKRRLLKEAKRILKNQQKFENGARDAATRNEKPFSTAKVLTEEDYYEKNKEFSAWLKQEHDVYFSNLSADSARSLFGDFVRAWNSGKLSEKLYSGVDSATRTDHKWQFKGGKDFSADREEELEFMKKQEKSQRKKYDREHKELMDELLPKATGRERLLEKRFMRKEEARQREQSPDLLREQDIMGGNDDFKQRLERQRAQRERKAMEKNEALKEKQLLSDQKEAAAMEQFKALMDVAGGKITIPKRVQ